MRSEGKKRRNALRFSALRLPCRLGKLLCGGEKRTQARDVKRAKTLAEGLQQSGDMVATNKFDAAEYLDTTERQAEYISAALETGDAAFVRDAVGIVAHARGTTDIARAAGLSKPVRQ